MIISLKKRILTKKLTSKLNYKSNVLKKKGYNFKINYKFNIFVYRFNFNKNFIKIRKNSLKKVYTKLLTKIFFINSKYLFLMLNSISSFSKKLGESFIKVPFLFYSNSLSYSATKFVAKKIFGILLVCIYTRFFR